MKIGFNFTPGDMLPLVRSLPASGRIDYVELLIDNFLAVPEEELAAGLLLPEIAVAVRLWSRLARAARRLRVRKGPAGVGPFRKRHQSTVSVAGR
ncbi:hypothetical protein [Azospirillum sp. HJ39]|uniref:hypothetical protein n=1 Tax=Azospirillum sp. HJ39 TaxID=3159496 RepID=UPI00355602CF